MLYICLALTSSCTIYRSPERHNFESEYRQIEVQNLNVLSCSAESIAPGASASKLIFIDKENFSIWVHLVDGISVYESDNLKGEHCVYEYIENPI